MKSFALTLASVVAFSALGLAVSAAAEDDVCRWGGDNGESIKCFDCQRLVQVGNEWRWVNTCEAPHREFFFGYEPN